MSRREVRIAPGGARGPRPTGCGGRMGADRVVRPYTFCAGRRTPRAFVPLRSTAGRRPLHTLSLRASPKTGAAIRSQRSPPPLDKPVGMGIIIDVRGRCDKRSAPLSVSDLIRLYSLQKPSLVGVAVFAFQSLDSYRDRMSQNMNRKHEKHTVTPLQKEVTDRLAMYTASLRCIISRSPVFVNSHRLTNPAGWI